MTHTAAANVGVRFLIELEGGKDTAQIGKVIVSATSAGHRIEAGGSRRTELMAEHLSVWWDRKLVGELSSKSIW